MEEPLMFEHTLLLSSKGHYETTASHVEAVRNRMEPDEAPVRHAQRREAARKKAVDRLWNERRRMRRQRTSS